MLPAFLLLLLLILGVLAILTTILRGPELRQAFVICRSKECR